MPGCSANGILNDSKYGKPLPSVGLYIAGASFYCAATMAMDTYRGFRSRRLWFPSKYFTLNAVTLTILAVALKLPVDLNTSMPRPIDQLSKLSGTVLVCTVMGNFMPSLGVIDNSAADIIALGILDITVIINVSIQMGTGVIYVYLPEHSIILVFMLVILVLLISSALTVSVTKRQLEKQYDAKHQKLQMCEELLAEGSHRQSEPGGAAGGYDKYHGKRLNEHVEKYWLMAHTSSPQYVLGRSATCTASGAFCLLSALIMIEASVRSLLLGHSQFCSGTSDYRWSIILVLLSQEVAVVVGTIAPAVRWFNAVSFRSNEAEGGRRWWDHEFTVESYWVEKLREWKETPLPQQFGSRRCRKITHNTKNLILGVLIKMQMGVVLASKVVRLFSIMPVSWLDRGRRLLKKRPSFVLRSPNLEEFVLHLEGEKDLVKLITRNERKDTDRWILKGSQKQPKYLVELMQKWVSSARSRGFTSVGCFDSNEVPSLVPQGSEPTHCWALPLVTLASIAVALPGNQPLLKLLLSGVGEGLKYVKQIEKNLEAKGLLNQRKAADIVWSRLSLYNKWFDTDLCQLAAEHQSSRKVIEKLKEIGKASVLEFMEKGRDGFDAANSLEWPPKMLAANCMYRVTSTILQDCDTQIGETHLPCCWLGSTIADLLGACLTNLPEAIYMECFCNAIEVREESVRDAAFLLGEAEEIMRMLLEDEEAASSYPREKAYVDNWRDKIGTSDRKSSFRDDVCLVLASASSLSSSLTSISSYNGTSFSTTDESVRSVELTQQQQGQLPPEDMDHIV